MTTWIRQAVIYFGLVFAAGFAAGLVRVLVLAPAMGAFAAVAMELPVMLAFAWFACRRVMPETGAARPIAVGILAFALLMIAELALAMTLGGQTLAQYLSDLAKPAGLLGLVGQMLFAAFPKLQAKA
jgi:hypothetical protein